MRALAWWLIPIGATMIAAVWVGLAGWWRKARHRRAFGSIEDVERFRRALARPDVVGMRPPVDEDGQVG
ncbi:MAG: hypothetical protein L0Y54_15055 [Sporichthyaceae bacterium]|nr:hypothetical protein [Sporichthyaceae bacterium]